MRCGVAKYGADVRAAPVAKDSSALQQHCTPCTGLVPDWHRKHGHLGPASSHVGFLLVIDNKLKDMFPQRN
jgi:hypothetical protein